jgi:hypothetical protein
MDKFIECSPNWAGLQPTATLPCEEVVGRVDRGADVRWLQDVRKRRLACVGSAVVALLGVTIVVVSAVRREWNSAASTSAADAAIRFDTADLLRDRPILLSPDVPIGFRLPVQKRTSILRKVEPLQSGMSASLTLHVLLAQGLDAQFHGGRLASSAELLKLFADDRFGQAYFGMPLMTRTRFGIRPAIHGAGRAVKERHYDQTLGTMTQLGLPLSFPIKIGGESYTLRDILRDAIASFDLHQGEIEWTAIAYATYLPPYRQWINKFGDRYSFDDLVKELLKRRFDRGSCCGCHVLEGMIVLERTDRQVAHLLSDEVRRQLQSDRCNQRILCGVITWRRGLSGIHRNDAGCRDGEITRCGEGEVLAGGDSAAGSQWTGNEAVLCPGRDSRTSALLVATNAASARSAPSPSVAGRRGGGLGP